MKILFTAEYDEKYLDQLKEFGEINIQGWAKGIGKLSEEKLIKLSKDVDIIITSYDDITKKVIENCKNLKLIACTRSTPVNIDIEAAKNNGVRVVNTPGRNSDSTAEHTIGLMISIARKIPMAYRALKNGEFTGKQSAEEDVKDGLKEDVIWDMDEDSPYVVFKGTELKDKTLGIIGFGSIGKRVANIAASFGMNLLIYDPYVSEIDINRVGRSKVSLAELLESSDFITTHLKVTPETRGLIGKEEFAKMKESAYFINTSRAAVIDEEALIEVLKNKQIAGAALDVFAKEPIYRDHPFITELDNIVITPHIAGATNDVLTNHTKMIIAEIKRFLNNETLLYEYK
ncbi:MAG: 2-hydroxyacid dehydrogenase [Halanaerobium sp.]